LRTLTETEKQNILKQAEGADPSVVEALRFLSGKENTPRTFPKNYNSNNREKTRKRKRR